MDAFNFVFTLFGLLLGFTLVEVLAGLARTLKARRRIRIGWLTPMLAIFVMMDVLSFWSIAWQMRVAITPSYGALLFGLVFAGVYYLAASLIFPDKIDETPDLDEHYGRAHRWVLGGIAVCNLIQLALTRQLFTSPTAVIIVAAYYCCLAGAIVARRRWPSTVWLAGLIAVYLVNAVLY